MSFSSVVRRGIIVVMLVLLNASLHRANRLNASRVVQVAAKKPEPKKTRPSSTSATDVLCEGPSVPILPPSFILPRSLWSVRAMMFLQILPDGTVNGTLKLHKYAKLNIEMLGECGRFVRIKGVASQRYLAMEANGTLVGKTQPDQTKSIFTVQLQKGFFTFKNGKYFIAFKHGGGIKKVTVNGRRSTRFVLVLPRKMDNPRKRRFPSDFGLLRSSSRESRLKLFGDLQRR